MRNEEKKNGASECLPDRLGALRTSFVVEFTPTGKEEVQKEKGKKKTACGAENNKYRRNDHIKVDKSNKEKGVRFFFSVEQVYEGQKKTVVLLLKKKVVSSSSSFDIPQKHLTGEPKKRKSREEKKRHHEHKPISLVSKKKRKRSG